MHTPNIHIDLFSSKNMLISLLRENPHLQPWLTPVWALAEANITTSETYFNSRQIIYLLLKWIEPAQGKTEKVLQPASNIFILQIHAVLSRFSLVPRGICVY